MGDIQPDLTYRLRNWATTPALCAEAADEIVRLREELAQVNAHADAWTDTANRYARDADRWKADADRLAEQVARLMCACEPGNIYYRCSKCVVLDLHDREVEAR